MEPMVWDPQRYLDRHGFIIRRGQALVDLLDPRPGERILDLGCGTGDLAAAMVHRGASVVAVDASPDMVAAAAQRFPDLDVRVMDAADLPFAGDFDAIFSHAVLHWVKRAEVAAAGMARALKPGGRLVLEMGGHGNCRALESAFAGALESTAGRTYLSPWHFPALPAYSALLEAQGLTVRVAWYFDLPSPLAGEDGLRQWVFQFLPHHLEGLDGHRTEAVLAAMENILRPSLWRESAWWADYRRLRLVATKPMA